MKGTEMRINDFFMLSKLTVGFVLLGVAQGCSTACADCGDDGGGGAGDSWPAGWDPTGKVVKCQLAEEPTPTTGDENDPSDGFTCVARDSLAKGYNEACSEHALDPLYLQSICATTFGGVPSDYRANPIGGWFGELDDYPTSATDNQGFCDVNHSFSEANEDPVGTDMVPLSSGELNPCSRVSYCDTLAAIIATFPIEEIPPDPWCNVSPGGNSEEPGPWQCVGSSTDACGHVNMTQLICPIVKPGDKEYCVIASSELEASGKCSAVCDKADASYESTYDTDYTDPVDCGVFDGNTMVWVSDVVDECFNVDYEITSAAAPFHFTAELTLASGANASSSEVGNLGFIDYDVVNCVGFDCDITINGLELSYAVYSGTYYDEEENPYSFSVDGVSVHLAEPVTGVVISQLTSPATVSFPAEHFELNLGTGDVEMDSVSLGALGPLTLPVTDVTGFYSSGVLYLFISYETVDATMLISLTTF
jgi:hypothetical protein